MSTPSPDIELVRALASSRENYEAFRPFVKEYATLPEVMPIVEDLGSGWLGPTESTGASPWERALANEPVVGTSLRDGADIVLFSGDKLLGGPQAGLILGRRDLLDRVRKHPLMRALRVDKVTYALLESTLALWAEAPSRELVPVYRMLTMPLEEIDRRAKALASRLSRTSGLQSGVIDGESAPGGGSAPGQTIPTRLVTLSAASRTPSALLDQLRTLEPPIIARIVNDHVVLDLRTVLPDDEEPLALALSKLDL